MSTPSIPNQSRKRLASIGLTVLLVAVGLAIRLSDLTDLPLDFHPTRQLLSQLKARGMYYQAHPELPDWQRRMAIQQWKTKAEVEPEIFERLVAATYELTGVQTWVARAYASLFWILGGIFLYLLAREFMRFEVATISLGYFLFQPYAITASRSFQPDVLMLMLIPFFWWAFARWTRTESWSWTILAGLGGGLAILVKFVAVFFVLGAALGLGLAVFGLQIFRKRQILAMAALGVLPAGIYLYYGLIQAAFLGRQFNGRFIPALLLEPANYLQWAGKANLAAGGLAIALGLLGLLIVRDRPFRSLLLGLWISYLSYGLVFDYHIATHDYYHLPLIAVVALAITPVASILTDHLEGAATTRWRRLAVLGMFLYAVFSGLWEARARLLSADYRPEAGMWAEIGERLGHGPNVVALTQDYGSRLAYWGWQNSISWPDSGDIEYRQVRGGSIEFEEAFSGLTYGNAYFLVTDFDELKRQPDLAQRLREFEAIADGDGYIIYDLQRPSGP